MLNLFVNLINPGVLTGQTGKIVSGKEVLVKRFARTVKKNAKFLSGLPETVRYTARSVFPGIRKVPGHLRRNLRIIPAREVLLNTVVSVNRWVEKIAGPVAEGKSQVFALEKHAFKKN